LCLAWLLFGRDAHAAARDIEAQHYDASCGLASLATLLSWSGRDVSEEQLVDIFRRVVRPQSPLSLEEAGISAAELSRVATYLGVEPIWRKQTLQELERSLKREPLLIVLRPSGEKIGHYTIAEAFSDGKLCIADSMLGRVALSREETDSHFLAGDARGYVMALRRNGRAILDSGTVETGEHVPLSTKLAAVGQVLARPGEFVAQLDLSHGWSHSSSAYAGLSIRGEQSLWSVAPGLSYGVTDALSVGLRLPFQWGSGSASLRFGEFVGETSSSYSGLDKVIGDMAYTCDCLFARPTVFKASVYFGAAEDKGGVSLSAANLVPLDQGLDLLVSPYFVGEVRAGEQSTTSFGLQVDGIIQVSYIGAVIAGVEYSAARYDDGTEAGWSHGVAVSLAAAVTPFRDLTVSPYLSFSSSIDGAEQIMTVGVSLARRFPRPLS
jgi:predicted double-glycine peptidase